MVAIVVLVLVVVLVLERAFLSKRFGITIGAFCLHCTRPAKQRYEIEDEIEPERDDDLLQTNRLFGNDRTLMRVILIRPDTLVSMLGPCLLTIVCSALVAGTEDLGRVDFCTKQWGEIASIERGDSGRDISRD